MKRASIFAAALFAAVSLAACAQVPTDPDERAEFEELNDPFEPMNRAIFDMNMALDRELMKPVATFYRDNVPYENRKGLHNVLDNMGAPFSFANYLLQANPHRAADVLGRFMINSTWGVLGYYDVVSETGGPRHHSANLGQTLQVWGVPEGPFLMLPLFGPSNPRDAAAMGATMFVSDPLVSNLQRLWVHAGDSKTAAGMLDTRSRLLNDMDDLERNSIDLYAAIRSLSRQSREADIVYDEMFVPAVVPGQE